MKATQRDFAAKADRAAGAARIFFFCGPDEAGALDAASRIVALMPDPGERVELSGSELRRDPVRLGDEARSVSLFGETRHLYVRAQGDEAHDAVETLLASHVPICPVLIVATGATDKSRTAKLLADRPDALVAMFYPPDIASVVAAVRRMASAAGLRIDDAIAARLARAANLDTRLAQSEIDKLALYCDAAPERPTGVTAEALDAIVATTEEDSFAPLVDVVLGGASARLAEELRRRRETRLNPVAVALACQRRAAQLADLTARLGDRATVEPLLEAEVAARRLFARDRAAVAHQLRCWRVKSLDRLIDRLVSLHQTLLADSQAADTLLDQGLAEISRAAARRA